MNIEERITNIEIDVKYIKKMMEDLTLGVPPKNGEAEEKIKKVLSNLETTFNENPNISNNPQAQNIIKGLFKGLI